MARRVFFSFHFENDIWRANQVRNSNVVAGPNIAGFFDHSEYAESKKKDVEAIRRLIRKKMKGTSVTVVLIGEKTASRPFVRYEIQESVRQHNGLLGIYIHHLRTPNDLYIPLLSEFGSVVEQVFTPDAPSVPAGIEFPTYAWDGDLSRFRKAIEAAGVRSDRLRRGA